MRRIILVLLCLLNTYAFAQKTKTGVAVFGFTPAGIAAAIQSAHSGVKTVLADAGSIEAITLTAEDRACKIGLYADFIKRADSLQKTSNIKSSDNLTASYTASIFKGWTDTIKNLTVLTNATIKKIKKDGKKWEIELNDKREIKADAVIDASAGNNAAAKAGAAVNTSFSLPAVYSDKLYRTSVSIINMPAAYPAFLPLSALINDKAENFFVIGGSIPATILTGQGAGTAAAYCSFFSTAAKNIDVRKTQGELVTYRSQFIRFSDISLADSNAVSIQKIALTGILKGKLQEQQFMFLPNAPVSTEEIKLPMREYYSRSQIWFLDHKSDKITLEEALSLIKFTGSRGAELDKEVEKGWNTSLKLSGKFDLKKAVTRRELAALFDTYLKPFERSVDLKGNLKA